mmetsp:Transcript_38/g.53  ORF Transcript_38/g.53 Transcript_38/m.53 type:complete len:205 (-) Transcript_38:568-1182(-)
MHWVSPTVAAGIELVGAASQVVPSPFKVMGHFCTTTLPPGTATTNEGVAENKLPAHVVVGFQRPGQPGMLIPAQSPPPPVLGVGLGVPVRVQDHKQGIPPGPGVVVLHKTYALLLLDVSGVEPRDLLALVVHFGVRHGEVLGPGPGRPLGHGPLAPPEVAVLPVPVPAHREHGEGVQHSAQVCPLTLVLLHHLVFPHPLLFPHK